ncbi:GmrSD restriction endonuclease domain-containing protein [Methanococcoides alaskense]|uniref:GmrSD restriction endonucleases N-terminal domain-containing protein n=1 Tax=Methanococcoides alaskense TaxID=325778 RepID=A0AA90TXP8_9EURY|nr:DUF262 domain-containing protein [Methanococcoides alaskense]MDA0525167.1 DUF262 domain-containing protein [Methanococcoides alaskense]MDR6221912.1 hypothetical protein [Methanococcoides alaskense]
MKTQKYTVNPQSIEAVLSWVKSGEIAIPEIQRPFVWNSTQVRDLMDSLYQGYPIGYLIAWRNPNVKLKDGTVSEGKKILIDGQQRVMALNAAILGNYIIDSNYKKTKIRIAFHPIKERFEVLNSAIEKDNSWIHDISPLINKEVGLIRFFKDYCEKNPDVDEIHVENTLENLKNITNKQLGLIELDSDLDIETVTEVFIRINSKGVTLSQADFAMSKIAANEDYNGSTIRKAIDYFCHMAVAPEFYEQIRDVDTEFSSTEYFRKMSWLKNENDDLYDPRYTDMLRVVFTSEFERGRLSDLVGLLSGRNFETRTYEEEIAKQSFETLEQGIYKFMNEHSFQRFLMIIRSAGFISSKLIRSQNSLNFAYIVYLKLKSMGYKPADIGKYVRRWFVLSVLTGRYSSSPESEFDRDIKNIATKDFGEYLRSVEQAELSDTFFDVGLIQNLDSSVSSSPYFNVYLASQVKNKDQGFLSKDITVDDLISHHGDIHHIFPREYLKKNGLKRGRYNQIANYVYMQSEINIQVGSKAPDIYFNELKEQCATGNAKYGAICDENVFHENLKMNCIPEDVFSMDIKDYDEFLIKRRELIAKKIKEYYYSL